MGTCVAPGRRFRRVFSIKSSVFQRNSRKSRIVLRGNATSKFGNKNVDDGN